MIQKIKTWFLNYREKRRRKETLEIIKQAKQAYLDGRERCMCFSFMRVEHSFLCPDMIAQRIPEFKPSTFGIPDETQTYSGVWWDISDRESRIKAFDKLIEIYSK